MHFENYLTATDWATLLKQDASFDLKVDTMVPRSLRIGLKFPTEQTCKNIIAIVLETAGDNLHVRASATHDLLCAFKMKLKARRATAN